MKKRNMSFRRGLASVLTACMLVTSFPLTPFADTAAEYEAGTYSIDIQLDSEKIMDTVEKTIQSGNVYRNDMSFSGASESALAAYEKLFEGNVFAVENIPYSSIATGTEEGTPSNASDSNTLPKYAEVRMFTAPDPEALAAIGADGEADTASGSDAASASDAKKISWKDYKATGNEQVYFLFINKSRDTFVFSLTSGSAVFADIVVESGDMVLEEIKDKIEASGSNAEEATPSDATEDNATEEEEIKETEISSGNGGGAGSEAPSEIPEETDGETPSESTEESVSETTSESTEESTGETPSESTEESVSETTSESTEESAGETFSEATEAPESEAPAESTEAPVETETEIKIETTEAETKSESEKTQEVTIVEVKETETSEKTGSAAEDLPSISRSTHYAPRVSETLGEDDNAPKTPQEEYNMMMGRDRYDDGEEEEEASVVYSDDYIADVFGDSDGVLESNTYGTVLEPVSLTEKASFARAMRSAKRSVAKALAVDEREATVSRTVGLETSARALAGEVKAAGESAFTLDLFKYEIDNNKANNFNKAVLDGANSFKGKLLTNYSAAAGLEADYYQYYNAYYGSHGVYQKLVEKEYVDGKIAYNYDLGKARDFFEKNETNGVYAYPNLNIPEGFFDVTDGYYIFNGRQKEYNGDKEEGLKRVHYDRKTNQLKMMDKSYPSGFWPFVQKKSDGTWPQVGVDLSEMTKAYSMGMKFSFQFNMPEDGIVNGKDMIFEFAGDDDVWVFIDGKLALDLGGILNIEDGGGSINFATGEIIHNKVYNATGTETNKLTDGSVTDETYQYADKPVRWYLYDNLNATELAAGGYADAVGLSKNAYENHKVDFYYMERGGSESNCYMKFNIPAIPKSGITVQKNVVGKTDSTVPASFQFNMVHAGTEAALESYVKGEDSNVTTIPFDLANLQEVYKTLDADQYFLVEEINPGENVTWLVSSKDGVQTFTGGRTGIFRANTGYRITCTNSYGKLEPEIAKRAWKDWNAKEDSEYDITLEVTGDQMTTTTTTQGGAANVVFVIDVSGSMSEGDIEKAKGAVNTLVDGLTPESYVNVVTFHGRNLKNVNNDTFPTYNNAADGYYYENITSGWRNVSSEKQAITDAVTEITDDGSGTHSAAGILGAKHKLENQPNGNPSFVIYMTDGKANLAVNAEGKKVTKSSTAETIAVNLLKEVRAKFNTTKFYSIAYNVNMDWLKVDSGNFDKCYPASDTSGVLEDVIKDIVHEITSTVYITNPIVTDTLSENVALVEGETVTVDGLTVDRLTGPKLYLTDDKVEGSSKEPLVLLDKGTLIESVKADVTGKLLEYRVNADDAKPVATYNPSTRTITWYVADQLGDNATKTLTFRVKVADNVVYKDTVSDYPNKPDPDTGTHRPTTAVGENGYYSNDGATLTYVPGTGAKETEDFPDPVVQPMPDDGVLTITKAMQGGTPELGMEFTFDVTLRNLKTTDNIFVTVGDANPVKIDITSAEYTDTYDIKVGESIVFEGLSRSVHYEVREELTDSYNYEYKLHSISRIIDGVSGSVIPSENNTCSGNMTKLAGDISVPADEVTITYTNVAEEIVRKSFNLTKKVEELVQGAAPSTAETYRFAILNTDGTSFANYKVIKADGTEVTLQDGTYGDTPVKYFAIEDASINAASTVTIEFNDPDIADTEEFKLVEIDNGSAVKSSWTLLEETTDGETLSFKLEDAVKKGVTCTNTYCSKYTFTLEKKVIEPNPRPDALYEFDLVFTKLEANQKIGVSEVIDGAKILVDENYVDITTQSEFSVDADGRLNLKVKLPADGKVTFDNILYGATWSVNETLPEDTQYDIDIEEIKVDDVVVDKGSVPSEEFTSETDFNVNVLYTNKYIVKEGKLKIQKQIVDDKGDLVAIDEPRAFIFKVEKLDEYNNLEMTFTKTILVEGKFAETEELTLPVGNYRITEMNTMKYEYVDISGKENPRFVTVEKDKTTVEVFHNKKTTDQYFTDVSCKVNKAVVDGEDGKYEEETNNGTNSSSGNSLTANGNIAWVPSKDKADEMEETEII